MQIFNFFRFIYFYCFKNKQNINLSEINKILIIRNDHIGDLCLSLPLLNLINAKLNIKPDLLINEYTYDIVSQNSNIQNLIIQKKNDSLESLCSKLQKYDLVINLVSTKFNAQLCSNINAVYKIGYAYKIYNIFSFNRFIFKHRKNPPIHETDFCIEFLKSIGINIDNTTKKQAIQNTEIKFDNKIIFYIEQYIKKLKLNSDKKNIGIHPGDNNSAFNMNIKQYIELGEKLKQNYNVIYIFGPNETELLNFFTKEQKQNFYFVKGDLKLIELCAFIKQIDCLVSGSTGPMHIAGLMETLTVSIFSNKPSHDYRKWHPIKNKHIIIEPEIEYSKNNKNSLMEHIVLDKIVKKINKVLI